jgi:hypothetical protein
MKFKGDLIIADPAIFIPEEDWDGFVDNDYYSKLSDYLCIDADDGLVQVYQTDFDPEIIREFLVSVKNYMNEVFEPEDSFDAYEIEQRSMRIHEIALLKNSAKKLGEVPVESGQIGIFSLKEVLNIAPDFKLKDGIIIENFNGNAEYDASLYSNDYFIGNGNTNFFTI